jgi:signal transduction histidine kinase
MLGSRKILSICIAFAIGAIAAEIAVLSLSQIKKASAVNALNSTFKNQQVAENPYLVGQALTDLESLQLISCPVLFKEQEEAAPFFESIHLSNCDAHWDTWFIRTFSYGLRSANGEGWILKFKVPASPSDSFVSYLIRFLFWSAGAMIGVFVVWRRQQIENFEAERRRRVESASLIYRQIAHDLRSPISALNLVAEKLKEMDSPETDLVFEIGKRLNSIVNSSSKSAELNRITVAQIEMVVSRVASEFRAQLTDSTRILLRSQIPPELRNAVLELSDQEWARVLANIFQNSIEASAATLEASLHAKKDMFTLKIVDDGSGIEMAEIPKIGIEGYSMHKPGGQGLGLSSVRSHLQRIGGEMRIETDRLKGFSIEIAVPYVD